MFDVHFRIPLMVAGHKMFINGSALSGIRLNKGAKLVVCPLIPEQDAFSAADAEVIESLHARQNGRAYKWMIL